MANPTIGQTEDGHSYIGGDPADPKSWKAVGSVEDGHVFKGGDPSRQESWGAVQAQPQEASPQTTATESVLQHFGNAATFGYLPQIQAAVEPAIQAVTDKFLPSDPQGFNVQNVPDQSYVQRRDQYIQNQNQMSQEHPYASLAGTAGGAVASAIATGGGLSKLIGGAVNAVPALAATDAGAALVNGTRAATLGGRLGQAAVTGGAIGLLRNPGDTSGEVSPLQPLERAKNVGTDALTGALFQGGAEALGKGAGAAKNAGSNLATYAEEKALKSVGAMKKDFKRLFGDKASELGRMALDENLVSPGDTIADIANKATEAKNQIGQNIGSIYENADGLAQSPKINIQKIAEDYGKDLADKFKGKAGSTKIINELQNTLDEIAVNGEVGFKDAQAVRQSIDDGIKWDSSKADAVIAQERKALRNKIQDEIKNKLSELDTQHGTDLADQFSEANKKYSNIKQIEKMAVAKASGENANRTVGLSEQIAGAAGMAAKGPVAGVASAVGSKLTKMYANPIAAVAADKISKALSANPSVLGPFAQRLQQAAEVSPGELASTVELLIKKPEFKQVVDSLKLPEVANQRPPISRSPSTKFTRSNP